MPRQVRRRGELGRAGRAAVAGRGGVPPVRGRDVLDERLGRVQARPAVVAVPGRVLQVGPFVGEALAAHAALVAAAGSDGSGGLTDVGLVDAFKSEMTSLGSDSSHKLATEHSPQRVYRTETLTYLQFTVIPDLLRR